MLSKFYSIKRGIEKIEQIKEMKRTEECNLNKTLLIIAKVMVSE